jgi:hypothetical protein
MNTEMTHHNVDGIKYLMVKFDWRNFDIKTVIEYSFSDGYYCSCFLGHYYADLMLWMLKTFGYNRFDMLSILEMALKRKMCMICLDWNISVPNISVIDLTKEMLSDVHALVIMD